MRTFVFLLGILGLVSGLPGCGSGGRVAVPAGDRLAPRDQLYIEVSAAGGIEYWSDHKLGLKLAGEALGVKTEYLGPATYDLQAMATALEQAIAKKPQGLLVAGFEPMLEPGINKAVEAGIPVVTVDADLPKSKRVAFVGTGNYEAGLVSGKQAAAILNGKGKIVVTTMPGAYNLQERVRGVRAALAEHPGIEIIQLLDTQGDTTAITQKCVAVLQQNPDLAAFVSVEAIGGIGAATAVREANKVGAVKIIAMDRSNDVLQSIRKGEIDVTVVQQTALMPQYGLNILYNMYNHPMPISKDNAKAGVPGAPIRIDTGVILVDKNSCELFIR